jgi:Preprotein translocase subunit SecB
MGVRADHQADPTANGRRGPELILEADARSRSGGAILDRESNLPEGDNDYEQFLGGLSLISVGLKSCSATLDREDLFKLLDGKEVPMRTFNDSYKITQIGANVFEASGAFRAHVQESPQSKPVVVVECEFEAHLHGADPISKACVERFVNSEFRLILIPFARQFVSATTAQMSIPPLVIPLSVGSRRKNSITPRPKKAPKDHAKAR